MVNSFENDFSRFPKVSCGPKVSCDPKVSCGNKGLCGSKVSCGFKANAVWIQTFMNFLLPFQPLGGIISVFLDFFHIY